MVTPSSRSLNWIVPGNLGEDRKRVRIPLHKSGADLDRTAFFDANFCAVHDGIALLLAPLVIQHRDDAVAVHRNERSFLIPDGLQIHGT